MSYKPDSEERPVPLFPLGQIGITANLRTKITELGEDPEEITLNALRRHRTGDCGDCSEHDKMANKYAIKHGHQILSVYYTDKKLKFWVITEWDRSVTTLLLPGDY